MYYLCMIPSLYVKLPGFYAGIYTPYPSVTVTYMLSLQILSPFTALDSVRTVYLTWVHA